MAFTITRKGYGAGNLKTILLDVTADGAEANISTGLSVINHLQVTHQSMTTIVALKFSPNKNSSGTASNGTLGVSGLTSGDRFFVAIYGR